MSIKWIKDRGWTVLIACYLVLALGACNTTRSRKAMHDPFNFFVLGDWGRKGGSSQIPVADQMISLSKQHTLNLILTVGDNFYEDGVASITDEHWQASYEKIYKELTKRYPWYVTLGNHDYLGNITAQMDYHTVNPSWNMPYYYYSFVKHTMDGQSVRFIVLDTDPYITDYYKNEKYKAKVALQDTARQTRWLDSTLSHATEDWKIVFGHHPIYCVNAKAGETAVLQQSVRPLLDKYGVQAYICGHDHLSQYNRPPESATAYIISGGGSKTVTTASKEAFTLFSSNTPGFTTCSIKDNALMFSFIDTNGRVMYSNTIYRDRRRS